MPNTDVEPPEVANLGGLFEVAYQELRAMARRQLRRGDRLHTLETTGLIHEAYLKLAKTPEVEQRGRTYFYGAASRAMRQVLVDAARRRLRTKRGSGQRATTYRDEVGSAERTAEHILQLDDLISRLAKQHPRPARVLECRAFGGLSIDETAEVLSVSRRTVDRDGTFARAWLLRNLGSNRDD